MSLLVRRSVPASRAGGLLAFALLVVGACTTTPGASVASSGAPTLAASPSVAVASASPAPTPSALSPAPASPVPSGPASSAAGQTDTAWGRIWDALPPSFPSYPGAQPTQTGAGPASATLQLPAQADVAADWTREALEAAGFTIAAANGPLEDGGYVIDVTGTGSCKAQISIAPMGGVTIATIFVGADCPFS